MSFCGTKGASCRDGTGLSTKRCQTAALRPRQQGKGQMSPSDEPAQSTDDLVYRIELWEAGPGRSVERTLARALSVQLARAIFKAAEEEYPGRRITLNKHKRTLADTARTVPPSTGSSDVAS
jgi:hypothetical protein